VLLDQTWEVGTTVGVAVAVTGQMVVEIAMVSVDRTVL
jgi:hypothetical protein